MPRTKKVTAPASIKNEATPNTRGAVEEGQGPAVPETPQEAKASKTEFAVHRADGGYVRAYSLADHGENAEALAHQFAGKIGGTVS